MSAGKKVRHLIGEAVIELRDAGLNWKQIGEKLGVSSTTAHMAADPEYAAHRYAVDRARRKDARKATTVNRWVERVKDPVAPIQVKDTRTFTARFAGDPLPGRSALDQRRGQG